MKLFWAFLGILCLGLGSVGIVLPVLPTVPFYLATAFCFTKGSRRLHQWFVGTRLYEKYLDSYVRDRRMTIEAKIKLSATVTGVMAIGFLMMREVLFGRIVLAVVWLCHLFVVFFRIETKPADMETKRVKEQQVVAKMIELYCIRKHGEGKKGGKAKAGRNAQTSREKGSVCEDCQRLTEYAVARSERCPFMENKTFCSNCRVHCYKPEMREKIRKVMRFSGPRMLLYHPVMAIWHLITGIREKRKKA